MGIDTVCIELTNRCPLRCSHCSAEANPERSDFFSLARFESLIAEFEHIDAIYLSGGEPFEHPELERFVELSRPVASEVAIYSSGAQRHLRRVIPLPEERLAKVAMRGVSRIDFSIYSNRPDEHDAVTGAVGSLAATMETMRLCRALGIQFGVHFVPLVEGGLRVRAVAALAREMRASRFHLLAIVPQGRGLKLSPKLTPGFLSDVASLPDDPAFSIILSTAIRIALRRSPSPRESKRATFIDVHGIIHPSEGRRLPAYGAQKPHSAEISARLTTMP